MIWLISANSKMYDHYSSFKDNGVIDWKMNNTTYEIGDIVYIYSTRPQKRILYKCKILKINTPYERILDDSEYWLEPPQDLTRTKYARFQLIKTFNDEKLSLDNMLMNGLSAAPQGPIKLSNKIELFNYISTVEDSCEEYFTLADNTSRLLYCNVAPMEKYQGIEDNSLLNGGKYIKEHGVGFELYNYQEIKGYHYGFVQPPTGGKQLSFHDEVDNKFKLAKININRLGASNREEYIDGVTIVWVATHASKGRMIVGWYKNARVYREQQKFEIDRRKFYYPNGDSDSASFYFVAKAEDSVLLPIDERSYRLPKGMGQSNIWYGNSDVDIKIRSFINSYNGDTLYDAQGYKERLESEIENIPDKYKESVIKSRIGQSNYRNALLRKFHSKCALCGVTGEELLVASHIKPWKDCEEGEHLDENNGLLLCPNHDKVFDRHLISFDENGKIVISSKLNETNKIFLNLNSSYSVEINEKNRKYFNNHYNLFLELDNNDVIV